MKKILLLLLGLTIAVGASADVKTELNRPVRQSVFAQKAKAHAEASKAKKEAARQAAIEEFNARAEVHKAQPKQEPKLSGGTRVIDEQPDGEVMTFTHFGYIVGKGHDAGFFAKTSKVVFSPNGQTVYIERPVANEGPAWVMGTLSGNKITVPMGQFLYQYENSDNGYVMVWGTMTKDDDGDWAVKYKPGVSNATYTIDFENQTLTLDNTNFEPTGPDFEEEYVSVGTSGLLVISNTELEEEYFYGNYSLECASYYQPQQSTNVIYDEPEGEARIYKRSGSYIDSKGTECEQENNVYFVYAPDGETVYISDIAVGTDCYSFVKGTIRDGKIVVPLGQYIYSNGDEDGFLIGWGQCAWDNDEERYITSLDPRVATVTYTIDGDNLVMDNTRQTNSVREGLAVFHHYSDYYDDFSIEWNTVLIGSPHVIYDQPDGAVATFMHTGTTIDTDKQEIINKSTYSKIVIDPDNGLVYIQNPIAATPDGSWVKGTVNGNKITIPMGQHIYWGGSEGAMLAWGSSSRNGDGYLEIEKDPTVTEATFTINNDGTITIDNTSGGVDGDGATGLVVVWVWDGGEEPYLLEWNSEYTAAEIPTVITEQPEGELVTYNRSGYSVHDGSIYDQQGTVDIVYASDGETVYICDVVSNGPGTWVMGTKAGNKIHVPMGQYIYYEDGYGYGFKLGWGQAYMNSNEEWRFNLDPSVTEVTFTIYGDFISLDNSSLGPNDELNGTTGLAVVVDVEPDYLYQVDVFTKFSAPLTIITQQPEGTYKKYFRSIHTSEYKDRDNYYVNSTAEMVYSENSNVVYIKGIVQGTSAAWIKGTIVDGKIHVPLGQCLEFYGDYHAKLRWVYEKVTTNGNNQEVSTLPNYDVIEATFTIDGDKITLDEDNQWSDPQSAHKGLGVCWYNASGSLTNAWPVNLKVQFMPYFEPTVLEDRPEGELKTFNRRGNAICHKSEVYLKDRYDRYPTIWPHELCRQGGETYIVYAPDGRTVYLYEPVQCWSNVHEPRYTWVMGALSEDGHKIIVPLDQYVSWNPTTNTAERLGWGTSYYRTNRYGQDEIYVVPDNSVMTLTYTIQDDCISMDNSSGQNFVSEVSSNSWANGNTGLTITDQFGHWRGELNWSTTLAGDHPAVPIDPVVEEWYDNGDETGGSALISTFELTDVDGYGINEEGLSYSIYTDRGKLFTFEATKYGLQEDVTEVTYDMWQDNYMLRPDYIRFYRTNAEGFEPFFNWRIGIQLHYTCNSVKQSSNIVYLEVFDEPDNPSGSGDVNGDGELTIKDVTMILDFLLGSSATDFNELNADVTGDGLVTIADATTLIDMLLGGN